MTAGLWALDPVSFAWEAAWAEWQHNASTTGNGTAASNGTAAGGGREGADDSVRCRHSRICEGPAACGDTAGEVSSLAQD